MKDNQDFIRVVNMIYISAFPRFEQLFMQWKKVGQTTYQTWPALFKTKGHARRLEHMKKIGHHLNWLMQHRFGNDVRWEIIQTVKKGAIVSMTTKAQLDIWDKEDEVTVTPIEADALREALNASTTLVSKGRLVSDD